MGRRLGCKAVGAGCGAEEARPCVLLPLLFRDEARPNSELLVAPMDNPTNTAGTPLPPPVLRHRHCAFCCLPCTVCLPLQRPAPPCWPADPCSSSACPAVLFPSPAVLLPHREDVKLEHVEVSRRFLASFERQQGLQQAVVYRLPEDGSAPAALAGGERINFEEPAYELRCSSFPLVFCSFLQTRSAVGTTAAEASRRQNCQHAPHALPLCAQLRRPGRF